MQSKNGKIEVQRGDICTRPLAQGSIGNKDGDLSMWKKKKDDHTLIFLVALLITTGHSTPPQLRRSRLTQWTKALQRSSGTSSENIANLGLTMPRIIFSLLYVCSFTACTIVLMLCQNLQGDSHEQWDFWAGDHHPGNRYLLDTYLPAKQNVEAWWEPCGCTSYLSTSLPTASWHERAS